MSEQSNFEKNGPLVSIAMLVLMVVFGTTLAWFASRPVVAALYGLVRSVELPFLNGMIPYGQEFHLSTLRRGHVPDFWTIYKNSAFYGMFWWLATFGIMFVAYSRLADRSIAKHVHIPSKRGRTFHEVMERYATTEPHVRFFLDYNVIELPTEIGTARQSFTALETLLYADAIKAIVLDPVGGERPKLDIDRDRMEKWYRDRFGPPNPFVNRSLMHNPRLMHTNEIHEAVDHLRWDVVLMLAPAVWRISAFYGEAIKEGLEHENAQIDAFISGVWVEINSFKTEFGRGITLGGANDWDRAERAARFARERASDSAKGRKAKAKAKAAAQTEYAPHVSTEAKTAIQQTYEAGAIARGEVDTGAELPPVSVGPQPDKVKPRIPERLLFFGEVLSERGPTLKSVARGREILKEHLTRHLGAQRERYPVRLDPKTKIMVFDTYIRDDEEQAFNQQAQERLNLAAHVVEKCLFGHSYQFGIVGAALDKARESGIMPPNLFRYLRFCDETQPMWWFVHNLGMPSAVPENAGLFEHYQAERLAGTALRRPFVRSAMEGLTAEAEKYLTDETVHELNRVLGGNRLERRARSFGEQARIALRGEGDTAEMQRIVAQAQASNSRIGGPVEPKPGESRAAATGEAVEQTQDGAAERRVTSLDGLAPPRPTDSVSITTEFHEVAAQIAEQQEEDPVEDTTGDIPGLDGLLAMMTRNATEMQAQKIRQAKAERDADGDMEDASLDRSKLH